MKISPMGFRVLKTLMLTKSVGNRIDYKLKEYTIIPRFIKFVIVRYY